MPEQIISASGAQYGMAVNADGSINTTIMGSIFIGSVSAQVDSIYIQSGNNVHLGSAWNQIGSVHVSNSVPISGNVVTGSEMWIMNPVGISGVNDIGSIVIKSAPVLGVSGAKLDNLAGSVGVTALPAILGSVYIKSNVVGISGTGFSDITGSVRISAPILEVSGTVFDNVSVVNQVGGSIVYLPNVTINNPSTIGSIPVQLVAGSVIVTGSIMIGSVSAIVESIYIQSGDNINITSMPTTTVQATNFDIRNLTSASDSVEIIGTGEIGSVVISQSTRLGVSGIVEVSNVVQTAGSIYSMPAITVGSVHAVVDSVYVQSGDNLEITSLPGDLGSVVISSAPLIGISGLVFTEGNIVGSFAPKGIGSVVIKSAPLIGVSGAIFDSGDITGSVVVSSANKLGISGIVEISGIVNDFTTMYKQYMDYDGGFQPVYIGLAPPGTGSETAGWMLRKNIYENDLPTAVLFGSGNTNFDKKWSERADAGAEYN